MIAMFWCVGCYLGVLCCVVVGVWLSDKPVIYVCLGWDVCIGVQWGDVGKIRFQAEVM